MSRTGLLLLRRTLILLTAYVCLLSVMGCAGFREYRREEAEERKLAERERSADWLNSNWKSGYGFNNPNAERIRQGLEPVNFDGSRDSEREEKGFFDEMIGNFVGDSIEYGVLQAATATRVLFERAFSR